MDKIYGYKQKDIVGLAEFLMQKQGGSLSTVFEEFAVLSGKAKGTVRNLYYALAKKSNEDSEFCQKYLNGKPITISKCVEFDKMEERELIKTIIKSKTNGKSVRGVIMQMAGGDAKTALRYQNKFRNVIKNKPQMAMELAKEIQSEGNEVDFCFEKKQTKTVISEQQFDKLKLEIDGLVQKISSKIKRENQYLKQRIGVLEKENLKLLSILYGQNGTGDAKKFFKTNAKKQFIN